MRVFILQTLVTFFLTTPLASATFPDLPSRQDQLKQLEERVFDVLVVGGGATGVGVALEAATRGLSVLLVERHDFASQTSSKSTKLAHGGVRYLEKAVLNLDRKQYQLVKDALKERGTLFKMAPYTVKPLQIVTPIYKFFKLPYMWIGLKVYDFISSDSKIAPSRYVSSKKIREIFPSIKTKGLVGGVTYYDGQFNDTRLNMMALLTAMREGAYALNYMALTSFQKKEGKITGAIVQDQLRDKKYSIQCRAVINATGPFSDLIRQMDDPAIKPLIRHSSGTHILLDRELTSKGLGMLIPKTRDGRVLFMLPWEGSTLVGTTDTRTGLTDDPKPSESEKDYLLSYCEDYFDTPLSQKDIKASWTGLRPLVRNPSVENTSKLCRDHLIEVSDSGLVSIMGGKWTTFRKMSQDTIDRAVSEGLLKAEKSNSENIVLLGGEDYTENSCSELQQQTGLDLDICEHLISSYGTLAFEVVAAGSTERIQKEYPYIQAEVTWAIEKEYAQNLGDILHRRIRLAFLDTQKTVDSIAQVEQLMQTSFEEIGRF